MKWILFAIAFSCPFLLLPVSGAFSQELMASDQEDEVFSAVEKFVENSGNLGHYAVAIDFTSWDFQGRYLGEPAVLRGEIVIYLREKDKFRRVSFWRGVVNDGEVVEHPWRTEFTRKGEVSTTTLKGVVPAISQNSIASFDPIELAGGTYTDFVEKGCKPGLFVSRVDTKKVLKCESDGSGSMSFVTQLWPDCQVSTTCSGKQGGMPVRTSSRLSLDVKSGRLKASKRTSDFKFLLCDTIAKWEKSEDLWLPTWVQMDKIYGVEKSEAKDRYEFELHWVVGEALDKMDLRRFESPDLNVESLLFEEVRKVATKSHRQR